MGLATAGGAARGDQPTDLADDQRHVRTYRAVIGNDRGDVAWDAVVDWQAPIEQVEIHLVAAYEMDALRCFVGFVGDTTPCQDMREVEPGHIVMTVDRVPRTHPISVFVEVGGLLNATPTTLRPPGPAPDDPGTGLLLPALPQRLDRPPPARASWWLPCWAG